MRSLKKKKKMYLKIKGTEGEIYKDGAEANTGASNRIKISMEHVTHARYQGSIHLSMDR